MTVISDPGMLVTIPTRKVDGDSDLCYVCMRPRQFCVCTTREWRESAACRPGQTAPDGGPVDPEWFHPVGNGHFARGQVEGAKRICRGCAVRRECLADALHRGDEHAVLGGLTVDERRDGVQEGRFPPPVVTNATALVEWADVTAELRAKGYSGNRLYRAAHQRLAADGLERAAS